MTAVGVALHRDVGVTSAAGAALAEFPELCRSLLYATVLTDDGFPVARFPDREFGIGDNRLAGMTSSVQALGDAVARELDMGSGEAVVLTAATGTVIQRRVPSSQLILAALFDHDETLGTALAISRVVAERLAARLPPSLRRP